MRALTPEKLAIDQVVEQVTIQDEDQTPEPSPTPPLANLGAVLRSRPVIPGLPESERKKAEQLVKKKKKQNAKEIQSVDEFEFSGDDSVSDEEVNTNKRKTVSPAASDKLKKTKSNKSKL